MCVCLYRSRDDVAFWKEKQAQVIKEEMRVRETIAKLAAETKQSTRSLLTRRQETATTDQVRFTSLQYIQKAF